MSGRLRYAAATAAVRAFPHGGSAQQSLPAAVPHGVPAEHSFHISRALGTNRQSRSSPLNRHNVEADALLDEIKRTKIGNVKDDMLKTPRKSMLVDDLLTVAMHKLEGTTMNMIQRDLVIECTQSLISDRQKKIGGNNIWKGWRVAAVTLAGFMSGNYISGLYHEKYEKPRLRQERKTSA